MARALIHLADLLSTAATARVQPVVPCREIPASTRLNCTTPIPWFEVILPSADLAPKVAVAAARAVDVPANPVGPADHLDDMILLVSWFRMWLSCK